MKIKIAFLAAVLLIASLVATGRAMASEDVPSKPLKADIQPSSEPLRRLAVALSSGREAMALFAGPEVRIAITRKGLVLPSLK